MTAHEKHPTIERRVLPRCPLNTDVQIRIQSRGEEFTFQTKSINISLRILELSCDDSLIQAILAQNMYPHECEVSFKISGQEKPFSMNTQVVTHRRLSQNEYQLVLRFLNPGKGIQEKLVNELAASLSMMAAKTSANMSVAGA